MSDHKNIVSTIDMLSDLLTKHQLQEIEISIDGLSARIRRHNHDTPHLSTPHIPESISSAKHILVASPTVGTFYSKPSPTDKDFVTPKQHVSEGQTIGLVESMKVFYPIYAPHHGTIETVHIQHGHSVEYQQTLFTLLPDTA